MYVCNMTELSKTAFLGDMTRITLNKAGHYIQTAMLMKALGHTESLLVDFLNQNNGEL